MDIVCPKCGVFICKVDGNTTPINVQVHCPYEGHDFGLSVPAAPPASVPDATGNSTPLVS